MEVRSLIGEVPHARKNKNKKKVGVYRCHQESRPWIEIQVGVGVCGLYLVTTLFVYMKNLTVWLQWVKKSERCSVMSLWPHGLQPARLLCPWDFPGKNTGVGCHFLLQGIFLTQGSNLSLLHYRQTFLLSEPPGKTVTSVKTHLNVVVREKSDRMCSSI